LYPVSEQYNAAVRAGGITQFSTCAAYYRGSVVTGAEDLPIDNGSVTDTSAAGVRRTLDLELAPVPGLYDLMSATGLTLQPYSVLKLPNGQFESVPMGVFEITQLSRGYGPDGSIKIQGSDKWAKLKRADFLYPASSQPGTSVIDTIAYLIRTALGYAEPINVTATSTAAVGPLVWDSDRGKAINDLAESIGAWVYFDRNGVATIADLPTVSDDTTAWSLDASASGVLLSANASKDRDDTYNVVVINSEKSDGSPMFDPVIVWDDDPNSPTYAGTDPPNATNVGDFGIAVYKYSSPLLQSADQATAAGETILARVTGSNSQLSLSAVRNHALDAMDTVDVLLPPERADLPRQVQRHLVDKVTHPLMPSGTQSVETRAIRSAAA
jgi:hypothetical protein